MASKELKNIFLSASIPLPNRNPKYIETADVIAIRDAVIALATTVLPKHRLIWGGHPSITPLINYVMQKQKFNIQEHVLLYQSKYFEDHYPADNNQFENIIETPVHGNDESSKRLMRELMFGQNKFVAGVFIGGMEGINDEYVMFKDFHPNAITIPLGSTGAASKLLYDNIKNPNTRFLNDYAFSSIFQEFILDKI